MTWDNTKVDRGTKAFSGFHGSECDGAYPLNFLKWVKDKGWWGEKRVHLCAGLLKDEGSFRIDIRPETKPDLVADATNTGLESNTFDMALIDPPYSRELAEKLYGTGKAYQSINAFAKEGARLVKPGGLITTLSYEVPKRIPDTEFIAVWGIYTIPVCSYMRCFTVSKKRGEST